MPELRKASREPVVRPNGRKTNLLPFPSLQAAPRDPPRQSLLMRAILAAALFGAAVGAAVVLAWLAVRALVG